MHILLNLKHTNYKVNKITRQEAVFNSLLCVNRAKAFQKNLGLCFDASTLNFSFIPSHPYPLKQDRAIHTFVSAQCTLMILNSSS